YSKDSIIEFKNKSYKSIKMFKVKDESVSSSKSHCKVGKISSRKKTVSNPTQSDFMTETLKKTNVLFTEIMKNI
ncbi:hypothetical protein, partial [Flavobacterium sp. A45]|uniref:hypothetical protein n=1 Tax=Flavobacterium sp. A45 TaxID=1945862 RepID=UPI001C2C44F6